MRAWSETWALVRAVANSACGMFAWAARASEADLVGRRELGLHGVQPVPEPATVRAHSRACTLSVISGNSRRNSTAAANSPVCWRISQH